MSRSRACLAALVALAACDEVVTITPTFVGFNPRLRRDVQPLDPALPQQAVTEDPATLFAPATYIHAPGGSPATAVNADVSLLIPPESNGRPLRNADCLWIAPSDTPQLFWEVIARGTPDGDVTLEAGRDIAGACTGSHPFTRELVRDIDGNELPDNGEFGPGNLVAMSTKLAPDFGPFFDPHDTCLDYWYQPSVGLSFSAGLCTPDAAGLYPNCMITGCNVPITGDQTLELQPSLGDAKTLSPRLKFVATTRQIARPLKFGESDGRYTFSWSVGETPDGRWTENFAPNLRIAKVRVFGLMPGGQRVYLDPDLASAGSLVACNPGKGSDAALTCGSFDPPNMIATPAYLVATSDTPLNWVFSFDQDPRVGGNSAAVFPCCEGSEAQCCDGDVCPPQCGDEVASELREGLFVEFTVVDGVNQAAQLHASPPALDFGPVEAGSSWRHQVTVENTGLTPLTIDGLTIEGDHPDAFKLSDVSLPVVVDARDHVTVTVEAVATLEVLEPEGALVIDATESGTNRALQARTGLRFEPYRGGWFSLLPEAPISFCSDAYWMGLLAENLGDRELLRGTWHLEGEDADAFELFEGSGQPWDSLEELVLDPGGQSVVFIRFDTGRVGSGEAHAELVADTDARNVAGGEVRIPLDYFDVPSSEHEPCDPAPTIAHES